MRRLVAEIARLIQDEQQDAFLADLAKPHALAMYFLRLGESANRVGKTTRAEHPQIAWQKMANLRHLIAHEYRQIDHAELWKLATVDAPILSDALPMPPPPEDIL